MIPTRARWLIDGAPARLAARFADAGHEFYLVGGSVRDLLLDRPSPDLDFTTDARPDEIKRLVGSDADAVFTVGEVYGTIGTIFDGVQMEITTFRAEVYVEESRKPEVTFGNVVDDDLERRDFTVNAMALRLDRGEPELIDPHGGAVAVATKVLTTPLAPEVSFSEDPLRMLRLFRFMSQLGFTPGADELAAVADMGSRIEIVSAERIRDELSKLLIGDHVAEALEALVRSGLADHFLPELPALAMEQDPVHRHKDVLAHSIAVTAKTTPDLELRLAAVLHDVGKPATREYGERTVTFHHHEVVGARMARERLRALRYPKHVVRDVSDLVFLHMRPHTFKMGWTDSAVRRYVRDAGPLIDKLNELVRCDVTTRNEKRARQIQRRIDELEDRIVELREREALDALRPPIDGNDVMEHLGLSPGPQVGAIMRMLTEHRIEHGPYSEGEAYELVDRWIADHGSVGGSDETDDEAGDA